MVPVRRFVHHVLHRSALESLVRASQQVMLYIDSVHHIV
jgi:hypothetical protein